MKHIKAPTDYERVLFARYRDQRASVRPEACIPGAGCWVEEATPAITNGICNRCHKAPRTLRVQPQPLPVHP